MKSVKYLLVVLAVFVWIVVGARKLAQKDGVLHDKTLVVRHLEA